MDSGQGGELQPLLKAAFVSTSGLSIWWQIGGTNWWHSVLLKASRCHFQEGIGISVILSPTTDTVS